MKRRNVELAKMRRPMKRNKITEGFYGSTLLYLKFLILWILVIFADFILEFRFEYLWPFYLLIRSVYDSFKYQGLAFSVFFVLIALTSDMLCFFFIPIQWLFFAASTYVWVQYVWHTDKGICAPTIVLWVLFVYLEAAVRLRDVKHIPGHLDLCRPFAAHCIGYPVVTLGFGFKSYVGYRMRQRKQQHVAKENQFYMQLMQQALPAETPPDAVEMTPVTTTTTSALTQGVSSAPNVQSNHKTHNHNSHKEKNGHVPNGTIPNGVNHGGGSRSHRKDHHEHRHSDRHAEKSNKLNHSHTNGSAVVDSSVDDPTESEPKQTTSASGRRRERREQDAKEREAQEYLQRLETEAKRLRLDLQQSRASEQELRIQVASLTTSEKGTKGELVQLQRQLEDLQDRLQQAQSARQADKQSMGGVERRLAEERRLRAALETQLQQERKARKQQEEARLAQAQARHECTELCKARRRELEQEMQECRQAQRWAEERCKSLEVEKQSLVEQLRDTDLLLAALSSVQEKNAHLENSLSAETRIKLDLFSALGEAKRQLEIRESANRAQEKEIEELKSKIAQVLAVMPTDSFNAGAVAPSSKATSSRVRLAADSPPAPSKLDPNATAYTPKNSTAASASLVAASTEA